MRKPINLAYILLLGINFNGFAANKHCQEIGGLGLAEATNNNDLVAALSGSMTGAQARILNKTKTANGYILDMEHYFISNKNGLLKTKDKATLTAVPGKIQSYMIEIKYTVIESHGTYEDYGGEFHSFGLIKLDKGKVVLRYKGKLCK